MVIELEDPEKNVVFNWETDVNVAGGEEFGQLLYEGLKLPTLNSEGYYTVKAELLQNSEKVTDGFDDIYTVDYMNKDCT